MKKEPAHTDSFFAYSSQFFFGSKICIFCKYCVFCSMEQYFFGVMPENALKSCTKCDWS